jgi:hypothetical protein
MRGEGETATAVVGNVMRTAVARSPVWTRGGSLGHARRRARERKGEASTTASGGFLKQRQRGRGGGSGGGHRVEGGNGEERGAQAWRGTAQRRDIDRQRPSRGASGRRGVARRATG